MTAALALALPQTGPDLSVKDLAVGASTHWEIYDGPPGAIALLGISFTGAAGSGFCLEPDACWVLIQPWILLPPTTLDGTGSATIVTPIPSGAPLPFQAIGQGFTVDVGPGGVDFGATGAVGGSVGPIAVLNETWEPPFELLDECWTTLNPHLGGVEVTGGELVLTPSAAGLPDMWFDDGEGLAVLREVTGDFEVSCTVNVHTHGDTSSSPATGYRLGGLVLRDPTATAPGAHEWCHVATGSGGAGQPSGVEWKETHASVSQWAVSPVPDTDRELRLVRSGNTVTAWHRDLGAPNWTLLHTNSFSALPATVQVGPMAYSFSAPPAVVARFDAVSFAP